MDCLCNSGGSQSVAGPSGCWPPMECHSALLVARGRFPRGASREKEKGHTCTLAAASLLQQTTKRSCHFCRRLTAQQACQRLNVLTSEPFSSGNTEQQVLARRRTRGCLWRRESGCQVGGVGENLSFGAWRLCFGTASTRERLRLRSFPLTSTLRRKRVHKRELHHLRTWTRFAELNSANKFSSK